MRRAGVVAPFDYLFRNRPNPSNYEATYNEEVDACVAVKDRIKSATRKAGFFATKDYSYRATKVAGDGWVMIGDAWGFLDPLYSSGVLLALRSGEMAADAIVEGLDSHADALDAHPLEHTQLFEPLVPENRGGLQLAGDLPAGLQVQA